MRDLLIFVLAFVLGTMIGYANGFRDCAEHQILKGIPASVQKVNTFIDKLDNKLKTVKWINWQDQETTYEQSN